MSTMRVIELADKLHHKENERLLAKTLSWIDESAGWAKTMVQKCRFSDASKTFEGYRLLFVLNHLCPALYHFHKAPDAKVFKGDIDGLNRAMEKHFFENTQACISKNNGWIQEGVHYDAENFEAFCNEVMRVILAVKPELVMDKYRKKHCIPDHTVSAQNTKASDSEWVEWANGEFWYSENLKQPYHHFLRITGERDTTRTLRAYLGSRALSNILLQIGGCETALPYIEEDMTKILTRGRFFRGTSKMMKGRPSKCHSNVCALWEANREHHDVHIVTGYALSKEDGLWRQHSWLVQRYSNGTQNRTRIIETTLKRAAYFGFEMTDDEAHEFCDKNW